MALVFVNLLMMLLSSRDCFSFSLFRIIKFGILMKFSLIKDLVASRDDIGGEMGVLFRCFILLPRVICISNPAPLDTY